jgi:hypothetical protein
MLDMRRREFHSAALRRDGLAICAQLQKLPTIAFLSANTPSSDSQKGRRTTDRIVGSVSLSNDPNGNLLELARRSTLICCLSTTTSGSSVARDRSRSLTIPKISLQKSNLERQHCPLLDQPPAD